MATYVVRQGFDSGSGRYVRGQVIDDPSKIPAALLARCCVRIADDASKPSVKPAPPAEKGA